MTVKRVGIWLIVAFTIVPIDRTPRRRPRL